MFFKRLTKLLPVLVLMVVLVTTGFGCNTVSQDAQRAHAPVTLTYWRVWDSPRDMEDIITAYSAQHPNVTIEVRTLRFAEYEQQLLEALAEDRGPDLFTVHNTWMRKYQSKLQAAPASVPVTQERVVERLGGFKTDKSIDIITNKLISPSQLRNTFVDVVADDVVIDNQIYGLPLAVDTMVLFYNRDILNAAGIPEPPQTWLEFQDQVKTITRQDRDGNIIQAGAAIGTADNVTRSFDILSLLMMQNGTVMEYSNRATFHQVPAQLGKRDIPPGDEATIFYTDFAYPAKEVYTWNDEMPNSFDAFISGESAFFFGYSYHLVDIQNRAPKLNFGYTTAPQIEGNPTVNVANYWIEGVSKKTAHANWAWDFLNFAATQPEQAQKYVDATQKPTALRSLIAYQVEQETLRPFVEQLLTAQSWYHGQNPAAAEAAFADLINTVVSGQLTVREAVQIAASKVSQTY